MAAHIKAVLFDLGNTLIHFDGAWPEVMQAADEELLKSLQAMGLELDRARFLADFRQELNAYYVQREAEFIEHTTAYVLRKVLGQFGYADFEDEDLAPALAALYAVSQAHWQVEEDALPTVEALHAAGYRMGIISNASDDADVQALVDKTGVRPFMDFVLSSAACGVRKPNPQIFETALAHWSFRPDQVAVVGDTLGADILGAHNAGLGSIWLTRHGDTPANRDHAETIQAQAEIASLAELPPVLEALGPPLPPKN